MRAVDTDGVPLENFKDTFKPDEGMIPPDLSQCQGYPNMMAYSPFNLGPSPKPVRCTHTPVNIALEIVAGKDGRRGSMALCADCSALLSNYSSMARRVLLVAVDDM
jgi:hypothetical protein